MSSSDYRFSVGMSSYSSISLVVSLGFFPSGISILLSGADSGSKDNKGIPVSFDAVWMVLTERGVHLPG
ncbi:hypothetical protein Y1Q_0017454 [Alligator mississippiensis]|uniref:Uncharacterized protein n=1 Tax=Alligator mississippiensis TaxID=8496 RepID=A0A151P1Z5_ALLMI|nr:hypothetical protein Y1Q_0017454 [Alligator mississippiensis]